MLHHSSRASQDRRRVPSPYLKSHVIQLVAMSISLTMIAPPRRVAAQSGGSAPSAERTSATPLAGGTTDLETLISRAVAVHPSIKAASSRVEAARARVSPAGSWPDPVLMAGIQNAALSADESAPPDPHGTPPAATTGVEPMTMKMVGVGQTIPSPGKRSLHRRVAQREANVAEAALEVARRRIAREVRDAYYELTFIERALAIVARNQDLLATLIRVTEARYGAGSAGQQDVLKARVEASRLAETAVSITEQRRATLARLNALLNQPSEAALAPAEMPTRIVRAAIADSTSEIRFVSTALGARAAGSPLPSLAELQEMAIRGNAEIREHEAMIAAQAARVDLAREEIFPDFDVALQYGQRSGYPDMFTATVSVPVPIHRRRKQDQLTIAAGSELSALEAEHHARQNEIRAEVARLVSDLERNRAQLALFVKAVLPQSRASLASATASYQAGTVQFLAVLDDQATLFNYETEYFRALADFARTLAELEQLVGQEILP